jgi:hypothetical protein
MDHSRIQEDFGTQIWSPKMIKLRMRDGSQSMDPLTHTLDDCCRGDFLLSTGWVLMA